MAHPAATGNHREAAEDGAAPEPLAVRAADGYTLRGFQWRHRQPAGAERPVVVINAATSVRCRYYARFATWLHGRGFDVLTYDYRGIGESRPPRLPGFRASWRDWARLDCEAMLQHAARAFPGQPLQVVGHSIGGFVLGLAPSNHLIRRILTVGAQFAYWRDYAPAHRWRMFLAGHVFMPAVAAVLGYFPARRLGWFEDTPRGVVRDWHRFGSNAMSEAERTRLMQPCAAVTAPILALSTTDDEYGTTAAIERLLGYFRASPAVHLRLSPAQVGADAIGHFAFFHDRFAPTLWPIALEWLESGRIPGHAQSARAAESPRT